MKKLFIAGYEENTSNYRNAFARLGILTETLGSSFQTWLQQIPEYQKASAFSPRDLTSNSYDGLILPGGGDISPALFGATNEGSRNIDEPLDRLQFQLLGQFLRLGKPVLGICKGLQIINVCFGGTILQDLPEESSLIHEYDNGDKIHTTKAPRDTFPEQLYGRNPVTNSAHHQAIGDVGDGLLVAQYTCDFVVEAIYHKSLPVLGVQWHPERMCFAHANPETDDGSLLLRYFSTLL